MNRRQISAGFAATLFMPALAACGADAPVDETVLAPGQQVHATNRLGTVTVAYLSPTKRRFEWDDDSRVVQMIARPQRFRGMLGLYEPASTFLALRTRLVVQEAIRHFETYDQIYAALYEGSALLDWVCSSDGLVVGFGRNPDRKKVNIELFQFLLQGRKPTALEGARNDDIRLTAI